MSTAGGASDALDQATRRRDSAKPTVDAAKVMQRSFYLERRASRGIEDFWSAHAEHKGLKMGHRQCRRPETSVVTICSRAGSPMTAEPRGTTDQTHRPGRGS